VDTAQITELGRVDTMLNRPEFDASVSQAESRCGWQSSLDIQQVTVRLQLAERENREIEGWIGGCKVTKL